MLIFSQDQMDALADDQDDQFVKDINRYLRANAGAHPDSVSDETLDREIRWLFDKAKSYGYSNHQDVYYFIEVVLICGVDFETNPQYQWLTDNLRRNNADRLTPIKQLYDAALTRRTGQHKEDKVNNL